MTESMHVTQLAASLSDEEFERQAAVARGRLPPSRQDVVIALYRTMTAFETYKAQLRKRSGLSTHARMVLSQLWTFGPMHMNEISSRVAISRAALTDIVTQLEGDGYVSRRADPADRRCTIIELTHKKWEQMRVASDPFARDMGAWVDGLDPDQWETVMEFCNVVHAVSEHHAAELRGARPRGGDEPFPFRLRDPGLQAAMSAGLISQLSANAGHRAS